VIEGILAATAVNLISKAANKWTADWEKAGASDLLLEGEDGRRLAIELKNSLRPDSNIARIFEQVSDSEDKVDEFVLITPEPPDESNSRLFASQFEPSTIESRWIGINELPDLLGIESPGDLRSPQTAARLQLEALVKNLERYSEAPVGAAGQPPVEELLPLHRQFRYPDIAKLLQEKRDLQEVLKIGKRVSNVTVVLSDIKNFSRLVKASRPEDLREFMGRYYLRARRLVWDHGGFFDKFVGDAVLAVFGYPYPADKQNIKAIRFSQSLVALGREILNDWDEEINERIQTGTRVGINRGDLWPLDIGEEQMEVTFIGDTINLAARLEKNSSVDGALLSHLTRTGARKEDKDFIDSLQLEKREISPEDAKGQSGIIRAWQLQ
jgi:class 3 adenylate cyclase